MWKFFIILIPIYIFNLNLYAQVIVPDFPVNDPAQNTVYVGRTAIAAAANGDFAVAWQDNNEYGVPVPAMPRVAVQLFNGNVQPVGPLNLFNGETRASIIYLDDYLTGSIDLEFHPSGNLLMAVHHEGLFDNLVTTTWSWETGIAAVSSAGQVIDLLAGSGVIFWLFPYDLVDNGSLRLAITPAGNTLGVLYGPSYNTDKSKVLIQQFDNNLNYVGSYFTPHSGDPGPNFHHANPDIGTNGTVHIVVWQDSRLDANYDISTQFYSNSAPIGQNQMVNVGDPAGTLNVLPSVAMNGAGNSVVVWADTRLGGNLGEIFGQRFNAAGQPVGNNFQISAGEGVIYDRPEVAMRNDGSFMVVWTDSLPGVAGVQALNARGRQFDANGNPTSVPFILPNQNVASGLANIGTNGSYYFLSWLDVRIDNVTPNVYAKVIGDIVGIDDPPATVISEFRLEQNFPNPFNPNTRIDFYLPKSENVHLEIYNLLGQKIKTLAVGSRSAGLHTIQWNGDNHIGEMMPSGIYVYRLKTAKFSSQKKMLLIR